MTDFLLLEELHKMIMELPRPRLMFRKGVEVRGFFRPYMSFAEYTEAKIFNDIDEITPVTARFSSMLGDRGTADTVRNIKGFAVKFHGNKGDYDLICQNLPVFFINKAEKLRELHDSLSVEYSFDRINRERFWKFVTDNPESINCVVRMFSCQGISATFINEMWYSVNTFIWQNQDKEKLLVRYKWVPLMGENENAAEKTKKIDRIFAEFMAGFDPDSAGYSLKQCIDGGNFPSFELHVQLMDNKYISHPDYLKRTIGWNEKITPPLSVGILKLTEVCDMNDRQRELLSFAPGNTVKGIEICSDEFSLIMNYAHKLCVAERGGSL